MNSGIYLIEIDEFKYVGCSNNITRRIKTHERLLKNNKHENIKMQRVYNIFKTFHFTVLEFCCTELLEQREIYFINTLNTYETRIGLNLAPGGNVPPILRDHKNPNYKKGKFGVDNPMFGKKRPDLSERNKKNKRACTFNEKVKKSTKTIQFNFNETKFLNPNGDIIFLNTYASFRDFCKKEGLDRSSVSKIIKNKLTNRSYKGWRLYVE